MSSKPVPDPLGFIRKVGARAHRVALHIPLDDSWMVTFRDLPRAKLSHPGHLIYLDAPSALNLLALAGLRVRTYAYSPVFRAPTGQQSKSQRLLTPSRGLLYRLSPYLAQKLLGGVSLMVLAETPLSLSAV